MVNEANGSVAGGNNTTDKLFLLSIEEVNNANYGFISYSARKASSFWWLRSPGNSDNYASIVNDFGIVSSSGNSVSYGNVFVRPAFNLDLNSVIFSSASSADKSSFASVGTDNVDTNTWKLTLKDTNKTVSVSSGQSVSQSGQTITVPYTYTGSDVSQISIMITDKAYTESDACILYYGALDTTLTTTGTGTFTLPTNLPEGYKIYMMAEDVNEATLTDYSSTPIEIVPAMSHTVTVTNGTATPSECVSGTSVSITANTAPSGKEFDKWTSNDGVTFADASSATTTFTMPDKAVAVTATYKDKPTDPTTVTKPTTKPVTTVTKPAQPKNIKVKKSGKAFTISWKKVSGATGYQVQFKKSGQKSWKNIKKVTKLSKSKWKTSNYIKGRTYQYKVRAYKVVNGKKVYGKWSKVIKIKKK